MKCNFKNQHNYSMNYIYDKDWYQVIYLIYHITWHYSSQGPKGHPTSPEPREPRPTGGAQGSLRCPSKPLLRKGQRRQQGRWRRRLVRRFRTHERLSLRTSSCVSDCRPSRTWRCSECVGILRHSFKCFSKGHVVVRHCSVLRDNGSTTP